MDWPPYVGHARPMDFRVDLRLSSKSTAPRTLVISKRPSDFLDLCSGVGLSLRLLRLHPETEWNLAREPDGRVWAGARCLRSVLSYRAVSAGCSYGPNRCK